MPKKQLRVWWIPQVPMDNPFTILVNSVNEGKLLVDALGKYDAFEFENNIKPDYSNVGGLHELVDGEWTDWEDEDGNDIDDLIEADRKPAHPAQAAVNHIYDSLKGAK